MATDPKYLVNTKDLSGKQLEYLYDIAKQSGIANPSAMTTSQITKEIKNETGKSGNTYGGTIGNKTVNQYGYKVVNGQLVPISSGQTAPSTPSTGLASIGNLANAVLGYATQNPSAGSLVNPFNIGQYNAINQGYATQLDALNKGTEQYITTLNNGAEGANAALDNARSNAIDQITRTYDDSARNYYRLYKRQEKDLPEQLSSVGATGGASESAALNLMNNYSDNLYKNEYGRNQQISGLNEDYYNAIAQNSQQLAQQIASAYLNLAESQAQLEGQKADAMGNLWNNLYSQYQANQQALAEQEQAKSAAALTSHNNSVRENEAERLRQGYTTMHWTDQDGNYHYQITGKKKVSSGSSRSGGSSKSGGSGSGNDDKNKIDSAAATEITNKLGAYLMGRPTLEPTEKQSLIANYLYGVVNKGDINQATAKQVLANLGYKEK